MPRHNGGVGEAIFGMEKLCQDYFGRRNRFRFWEKGNSDIFTSFLISFLFCQSYLLYVM